MHAVIALISKNRRPDDDASRDPIPDTTVPVPPIDKPVPVKEPEPDRLPDEEPLPNPDENPAPPQQVGPFDAMHDLT